MLALAIISTVFIGLNIIKGIINCINENTVDDGASLIGYIIGAVFGVAIKVLPIVTIWVLYAHIV